MQTPQPSSRAQELADDLWKDITFERQILIGENKDPKSRNSTLQNQVVFLEGEVERLKKKEGREGGAAGRGESSSSSGARPIAGLPSRSTVVARSPPLFASSSSLFFPSSKPRPSSIKLLPPPPPPPSDLDVFPDEILTEILHHLHQPFHFYHYSNALLGVADPPPGSRPWNPVGLQLVCRRWKDIARPLFYHQVAFDFRDEVAIDRAVLLVEGVGRHPLYRAKHSIWVDVKPAASLAFYFAIPLIASVSDQISNSTSILLVNGRSSLVPLGPIHLSKTIVYRGLQLDDVNLGMQGVGESLRSKFVAGSQSHSDDVHLNHLLIFRLSLINLLLTLNRISENLHHIACLPRLQLDFPCNFTPSLLDSIIPILTSILQQPSLPEGRDFILKRTGNVKKIIIGTHSEGDASAVRGKIDELGELEVVVEVVVLEM